MKEIITEVVEDVERKEEALVRREDAKEEVKENSIPLPLSISPAYKPLYEMCTFSGS